MITLQLAGPADRIGTSANRLTQPSRRQRLAQWLRHRRNAAALRQVEPRLLRDAGLTVPDAVLVAGFTINHHILLGTGCAPRLNQRPA